MSAPSDATSACIFSHEAVADEVSGEPRRRFRLVVLVQLHLVAERF